MSEEMVEVYRMMDELNKNSRDLNRAAALDCFDILKEKGYEVDKISSYQYRITKKDNPLRLDIYPTNKKFHNITTNKRGRYKYMIELV